MWQFLCQSWIFGQFHETVIWLKCWNCQFGRKKLKLPCRGAAACRQFQFFSDWIWQFQHFMPISRFHETAQKFQLFCQKLVTKLAIFLCQFQVKLWDNKIKKWTRFLLKLGLLDNFYANLQDNIELIHVKVDETACHRAMKKTG